MGSSLTPARGRKARLLIAAAVGLTLATAAYFPDRNDPSGVVLGGIVAFVAIVVGLSAANRVRPMASRSTVERFRTLALAFAAGIALGLANLFANIAIAHLDPAIEAQMREQWSHFSAWSATVPGPMAEEIAFRLVIMGGTAWLVSRMTSDRRTIFLASLLISSALFGLVHIVPGSRPTVNGVHATAVAIKSGLGGAALGWIFWRKGLPYSMVTHGLGNYVHLLVAPWVF